MMNAPKFLPQLASLSRSSIADIAATRALPSRPVEPSVTMTNEAEQEIAVLETDLKFPNHSTNYHRVALVCMEVGRAQCENADNVGVATVLAYDHGEPIKQLIEAAFTFPAPTGLGWDYTHPRALARLSPP